MQFIYLANDNRTFLSYDTRSICVISNKDIHRYFCYILFYKLVQVS